MKHFKMLLWLLVATLTLTGCSGDDDEETATNWFTRNFTFEITSCDRVGDNLIADFKLTNKSGADISQLSLNGQSPFYMCQDASGKDYYSDIRKSGGSWTGTSLITSVAKDGSITGSIRIADFDPTRTSPWVKLRFSAECPQLNTEKADVIQTNVAVSSQYIKSSGFQTNDRGLTYEYVKSWKKTQANTSTSRNDVYGYVTFRLTNHTGSDITDLAINPGKQSDDQGQEYYRSSLAIGSGEFLGLGTSATISLANDQSVTVTLRIETLSSSASTLSGSIPCSSYQLPLEDNEAKFFAIPVSGSAN